MMMKSALVCLFAAGLLGVGLGEARGDSPARSRPELVVLTYDSLGAKGGFVPEIVPLFEKRCACKVRVIVAGDGGQLLNRLQLDAERGKSVAHVVLGLDQHLWARARPFLESWDDWRPKGFAELESDLRIGKPSDGFLPFDYGVFALMVDRTALKQAKLEPPKSVHDLLKPEWKRKFLLEDPRTSTPGLALVLFTREVLGEGAWGYWTKLKSQWLSMAPGWDAAYGLFLKNEAPAVWSYTTSQAYHAEHGDKEGRYQAVLFEEGQPLQVEGAALVKGVLDAPGARARARSFLEFLISEEAQSRVPKTQWMLPSRKGVKLPAGFAELPKAKKVHRIESTAASVEAALKAWQIAISR